MRIMPTLYRETRLEAPADEVWRALEDVGAINQLIDFLGEVTLDGDVRTCDLGEHGRLEELMVSVDSKFRRVAYSVKESPFGFTHHHGSMQALPDGGATRFVWWTDFQPAEVEEPLAGAIDDALAAIERTFNGARA